MATVKEGEKLYKLWESQNIAEDLEKDQLQEIGMKVCREYQIDADSREEWLKSLDGAIKIAKQVMESKSYPWPDAANVKYPLITSAVISFASRTYPEIIRNDRVVRAGIAGLSTPEKEAIAESVSMHMSYQLLVESPNWEADTDKLLMILPLMGLVYRKTYFDPLMQRAADDLCLPDRITVHNHTKTLETARRITHELDMYDNDLLERMRAGLYMEIPLEELSKDMSSDNDDDMPHTVLEQHRFLDLDEDGYQEPYIVTVHQKTQRVLRIVARFDLDQVLMNEKGQVVRINPVCYFTDYHFIPSPDGTFHSIGYGQIMYPINETINATINQLMDAGTLANRQCGFIGKGLRMKKGVISFRPGEWVSVEPVNGTDIKSNIVPLPVSPPSPVSFQLLNLMIASGKDLASVTDILKGQQPTQNSPYSTVVALLEQGLKVHTAIVKRLHRSLKKEFEKLVRINRLYLDDQVSYEVWDGEKAISRQYYENDKLLVYPVSDPNMSSDIQRSARAQALMQIMNDPNMNKVEILKYFLETMQIANVERFIKPEDPNAPPPPDAVKAMAQADLYQAQARDLLVKRELEALGLQVKDEDAQARAAEAGARVSQMKLKAITDFAALEQAGQHFAIEQAVADVEEEQQPETLPQEQQIEYVAATPILQEIMQSIQQMRQPPQQPDVGGQMPPDMAPDTLANQPKP